MCQVSQSKSHVVGRRIILNNRRKNNNVTLYNNIIIGRSSCSSSIIVVCNNYEAKSRTRKRKYNTMEKIASKKMIVKINNGES